MQHTRRETFEINGKMIYRLLDSRDRERYSRTDLGPCPVQQFYKIKKDNQKYFNMSDEEKMNLHSYGNNNYLTAPKSHIGVSSYKTYYIHKDLERSKDWLLDDDYRKHRPNRKTNSELKTSKRRLGHVQDYKDKIKKIRDESERLNKMQSGFMTMKERLDKEKRELQNLLK